MAVFVVVNLALPGRVQVRFAVRQDLPAVATETAPGAEAGGGLCHDSGEGGERHALHAAVGKPCPAAGTNLNMRPGPGTAAHLPTLQKII